MSLILLKFYGYDKPRDGERKILDAIVLNTEMGMSTPVNLEGAWDVELYTEELS